MIPASLIFYNLSFSNRYKILLANFVQKKTPITIDWGLCYRESTNLTSIILFPKSSAANLTADCLRQFLDKFYDTRIFVRCGLIFYIVLEFLSKLIGRLIVFRKYNGSLDNLTSDWVWYAGDGTFKYRRVLHQHALYFKRPDTIA